MLLGLAAEPDPISLGLAAERDTISLGLAGNVIGSSGGTIPKCYWVWPWSQAQYPYVWWARQLGLETQPDPVTLGLAAQMLLGLATISDPIFLGLAVEPHPISLG